MMTLLLSLITIGPKVVTALLFPAPSIATRWKYHVPSESVAVVEVLVVSTVASGVVEAL